MVVVVVGEGADEVKEAKDSAVVGEEAVALLAEVVLKEEPLIFEYAICVLLSCQAKRLADTKGTVYALLATRRSNHNGTTHLKG